MLAAHGHGPEWRKVFGIGPEDEHALRDAILDAVQKGSVDSAKAAREGRNCVVLLELEIRGRRAPVVTVWNFGDKRPPHLVTAYPAP